MNTVNDCTNVYFQIYLYSFIFYVFHKKEYSDKIIEIALNNKNLNVNNRFFIMYQLIQKAFPNKKLSENINYEKLDMIYDKVFSEYKNNFKQIDFINKYKRNKDLVFVFISQFLNINHGPTKTVLDRCYVLIKHLNKKVILINTKEFGGPSGLVGMYNLRISNEISEYNSMDRFYYKGIDIPFYQPSSYMPDVDEYTCIIEMVKKYKPYLLFNIGGYSLIADLCSQIVPMATISTSGNYTISKNKGQFFIMGQKPEQCHYDIIAKEGHTKDAIIECPFTFDLKPQKASYTKKQLGIPEDKFVVVVIGGRLSFEIDNVFLEKLNELAKQGCCIVTIGNYDLNDEEKEKYKSLAENFVPLGFQEDVLACAELIYIYLNPKRQGGGTSAVECMFKGKPALSLKNGDVSILVNEEFLVNDYEEMINLALQCKKDKELYNKMSRAAKEKAEDLMDTKKYFVKAYNDIVNSPIFR